MSLSLSLPRSLCMSLSLSHRICVCLFLFLTDPVLKRKRPSLALCGRSDHESVTCLILCDIFLIFLVFDIIDKNFMVPVGGAILAALNGNNALVDSVSKLYPGIHATHTHQHIKSYTYTLTRIHLKGQLCDGQRTFLIHLKWQVHIP